MRHHLLCVLAAAVLFGTTGTAQALGPDGASPIAVGSARLVLGGGLLVLIAVVTGQLGPQRPYRRQAGSASPATWPTVTVAALGVAGFQLGFFAAVRDTGVAVGTMVAIGSAPAVTGLIGLARGERPDPGWTAATVLAIVGAVALVLAGGGDSAVSVAGVLLALLAGASYAVYTVAAKRLLDVGQAPVEVMARAFGWAAVLLLPVLLSVGLGPLASVSGGLLILYLAVSPTAIAYVLFARGLQGLRASTVSTLTLAEPLTAAVLGVLVLGERPSAPSAVGALLILSGLVVLGRASRRPAEGQLVVLG